MLFCVEHYRFGLLNVPELINFGLIATDAMVLDISLGDFILDISLRVFLPVVVNLLVNESVGLFEDLTNVSICLEFDVHLHSNEFFHDANLSVESIDLGSVRVFKVIRLEIHSWTSCHDINHDLNQTLLLKSITSVLICFQILETKLEFGPLEFLFPVKYILDNRKSIHIWQYISEVFVLHRLHFVNVE